MADVILDGFPPVLRLKFFQGSDARPGRCIIDTMVAGPSELSTLPRYGKLTIYARNYVGIWWKLRLVKAPRVRRGFMRLEFDDDRWALKETVLNQNYNERDSLGKLFTGKQKTIEELATIIADAAQPVLDEVNSLSIVAGDDLPDIYPPAKWAGLSANKAMERMLADTGCRMVYNPVTEQYHISRAGRGAYPDLSERAFRPGPPSNVHQVRIQTAPVLYEDTLAAAAMEISDTTGELVSLTDTTLPTSATGNLMAFRIWEPSSVTHPEALDMEDVVLLDHRAKTALNDPENPVYEKARIVRDAWEPYPFHQPLDFGDGDIVRKVELTGGGRAFITEHPVLIRASGGSAFLKTAELLTSYYRKNDDGTLYRNEKLITIDATASATEVITKTANWIKPVDSTESDMTGSEWDTILDEFADAMTSFYDYRGGEEPATVRLIAPLDLQGSGVVGGVEYEFSVNQTRRIVRFQAALNFTPGATSRIR